MHVEIGDHAARDELPFDEVAREANAFRLVELARDGELDLAGKLRVLPDPRPLRPHSTVPPIAPRLGRTIGQQHFGMHDAALLEKS